MSGRRAYVREGEAARRKALVSAALDLMATSGPQGATVRAIAARAGATPGLIRHYFGTKEALLAEAYLTVMDGMGAAAATSAGGTGAPVERLARFVAANLRPPVVDAFALGLWAGFMHRVQSDAAFRAAHQAGYLRFRDRLEALISACGVAPARELAIAVNAVIDGLWLEASALPEAFATDEVERIGVKSAGAILGLDLAAALVKDKRCTMQA